MSEAANAIIFDLKYTPYSVKAGATTEEITAHDKERAFYNMTGDENVLKYITTEGKRAGKLTALEYLQKSTGVFNGNGMLTKEHVSEMKERAKSNEGNIWHGFISLNEEDSPKIDTPEKCINLVKRTFGSFYREGGFSEKNIDLMCSLHLDKPHHLHIHFVFWEKEPKTSDKYGNKIFRVKGKVCKKAIDNMYVRVAEFITKENDNVYDRRVQALKELREAVSIRNINAGKDEILKEVIALAKDLPKTGRLSYGSKDMEPFKGRVDRIVKMLIDNNGKAQGAEISFYTELERKKQRIAEICRKPQVYGKSESSPSSGTYRYDIDEKNITVIQEIEADYKRRQGNLVLGLARFIKPEIYERKANRKNKANDNRLKKRLVISNRKVGRLFSKFLTSFGRDSELLERDFSNRLHEIEEEMKREKKKEKEESNKS